MQGEYIENVLDVCDVKLANIKILAILFLLKLKYISMSFLENNTVPFCSERS